MASLNSSIPLQISSDSYSCRWLKCRDAYGTCIWSQGLKHYPCAPSHSAASVRAAARGVPQSRPLPSTHSLFCLLSPIVLAGAYGKGSIHPITLGHPFLLPSIWGKVALPHGCLLPTILNSLEPLEHAVNPECLLAVQLCSFSLQWISGGVCKNAWELSMHIPNYHD